MPVITRMRFRRDTAANWNAANPVLALGEPGYITDTGQFKVGDGVTVWTSLPISSGAVGATGPAGPIGPVGPAGTANAYDFVQAAPSLTWTINHNRGAYQAVTLYSVGGVEMEADVLHTSINQVIVQFAVATAGTARLL